MTLSEYVFGDSKRLIQYLGDTVYDFLVQRMTGRWWFLVDYNYRQCKNTWFVDINRLSMVCKSINYG